MAARSASSPRDVKADDVQRWLDRYLEAWRTNDPATIASLFTEDATYAHSPWGEPRRGRDAIVADWLAAADPPGSWEATYRPFLVEGDQAIAVGETRYDSGNVYSNLWVLRMDDEERCSEFVEWYMRHPAGGEAAPGDGPTASETSP